MSARRDSRARSSRAARGRSGARARAARSAPPSIRVVLEAREALGLVLLRKRVDHVVDVTIHTTLEIRQVVAEPLVGESILREVVGAHLLGTLAAADLRAARRSGLELTALLLTREETTARHAHRLGAVLQLRPLVLTGHDLAAREVGDPHGGVGRVHALTALAAGAIHVDLEIAFGDLDVDLLGLREHGDGRGRSVDTTLCLGHRHALDAMHARLEFQLAVRAFAGDPEDDLLETTLLRIALRQHLDLPAMALGVARVHPVEIEREERRFFPTLPGADLHDDVLLIEGIARHQQAAQPREHVVDLARGARDILACDVAQVRVVGVDELPRFLETRLGVAQRAHGVDDRLQLRELLAHLADALVTRGRLGIGHQPGELVVALLDLRETPAKTGSEGIAQGWLGAGVLPAASASPASASSSDATATSIIPASGRRVVMRCSSRPGATKTRITGFASCAAPKRRTSYEIDATGMISSRRATRSTTMFVRGRNANSAIDTTTTNSRNAVPQRGCAVGYGLIRAGTSSSPCSNAWIVMCSAPWYMNTRRMSGASEIAAR